jgi:hypothetical protein
MSYVDILELSRSIIVHVTREDSQRNTPWIITNVADFLFSYKKKQKNEVFFAKSVIWGTLTYGNFGWNGRKREIA